MVMRIHFFDIWKFAIFDFLRRRGATPTVEQVSFYWISEEFSQNLIYILY